MNKFLIVIVLLLCVSCGKDNYKKTEFFLQNNCEYAIEVKSSVIVRYKSEVVEQSLTDFIKSGQLFSMRNIAVSENFKINDVFNKFEIYKGSSKSTYDVMDKSNWFQTLSSETKDEYTLYVDSTYF